MQVSRRVVADLEVRGAGDAVQLVQVVGQHGGLVAALAQVGLSDKERNTPAELSGGQQQRVAIARAIVTHPETLFADEPTGNLDSKTTVEIMDLLRTLNSERHISIIMVTHEDDVAACAGRVVHVKDGLIASDTRNGDRRQKT